MRKLEWVNLIFWISELGASDFFRFRREVGLGLDSLVGNCVAPMFPYFIAC